MKDCVILFDLDGTLIDSTEAIVSSFKDSFDDFGLDGFDEKSVISLIGYPLDVMYRELGVSEEIVWDMVDRYKSHYRQRSKQMTKLLPKARETIELAHSFARLSVVTTKTAKYSKELLEYFGLMEYFEVLIGREDVENPKPHPEPIYKALEMMQIEFSTKDIYMIGDTILDMESAYRANVNPIAVLCGYGDKKSLKKYTDILLFDTFNAVSFIKEANKADIKRF